MPSRAHVLVLLVRAIMAPAADGTPSASTFSATDPSPKCYSALVTACNATRGPAAGNCLVCCGAHQGPLHTAGCAEADMDSFCSGSRPPGPTPPPPPVDPASCTGVLKHLCPNSTSLFSCLVCCGAHEAPLKAARCTEADYTTFCSPPGPGPPTPPTPPTPPGPPPPPDPPAPPAGQTGCTLRAGKPAVYGGLCVTQTSESQCLATNFHRTCVRGTLPFRCASTAFLPRQCLSLRCSSGVELAAAAADRLLQPEDGHALQLLGAPVLRERPSIFTAFPCVFTAFQCLKQ